MAAHPLHEITCDDGTTSEKLEPPRWRTATYQWEPVIRSSIFEAYDASALKQVNVGASQKWILRVNFAGCREPLFQGLDQSKTWQVTIIDREALSDPQTYTMWPVSRETQSIDPRGNLRSYSLTFREA